MNQKAEQKQPIVAREDRIVELRSDYDQWLAGLKFAVAEAAAKKVKQKTMRKAQEDEQKCAAEAVKGSADNVLQQAQNDTAGGWYTTAPVVSNDGYIVKDTQEMKEVDSSLPEEVLKSFVIVDASSM